MTGIGFTEPIAGPDVGPRRRRVDRGALCWLADRGSDTWDWIDKRQLDAWGVLVFSLWMTARVLEWAMDFADGHAEMDGLRMAAIIGTVMGPWVTMQAALVKFHFEARKGTFSTEGK